jgi:hypothetical protein
MFLKAPGRPVFDARERQLFGTFALSAGASAPLVRVPQPCDRDWLHRHRYHHRRTIGVRVKTLDLTPPRTFALPVKLPAVLILTFLNP